LPSVVSGSQVVFFDPHRKYLPPRNGIKPAGLRTKFVKGNFEDQFRPYTRLFDFDMAAPFKGTLFRLPLRTKELHIKNHTLAMASAYLLRERLPKIHLQFLQDLIGGGLVELDDDSLDSLVQRYFNHWPKEVKEGMLLDHYKNFYSLAMKSGNIFYTRNNGGKWISYQEAVFEDETLLSDGIKEGASKIISDFLIECSINVVQLPHNILKGFPEEERKRQQFTPKLVRDKIRNITKGFVEKLDNVFSAFFEYLLSDKAFAELRGCNILPLMDKSFGKLNKPFKEGRIQFYIANKTEMALFPNLSSIFVDQGKLSKPTIDALTTAEATKALNVRKLDNDAFIQLVSKILCPGDHLNYESDGTIINDKWLDDLWRYLNATEGIEMAAFEDIPILPTIGPNRMLVSLDRKLPLLYEDGRKSNINAILTKIGTHLIDKRYSKRLSDVVLDFSAANVLKCIELASTKAESSIEDLLFPLSPSERNTLRSFLQRSEYDLFEDECSSELIEILRQLPIFPAHASSLAVAFKSATHCHILPEDFPVFSVRSGMAILCKNDTNHKFAVNIGIPELSVPDHLKYNVLPLPNNPFPVNKGSEYQAFLCKVLHHVEGSKQLRKMLTQYQIIPSDESPNRRLFKASELYDDTNPMFAAVFAGAGKFVAS
ncbi:hypothetical protein BC938DRAFT_479834, partial [Jimgerdemannia flammicorona]